jgi:hypothetical protein
MAWKRVVDIIPSNFLQTQMLPDHKYPIPQRKTLIRIIRESPQPAWGRPGLNGQKEGLGVRRWLFRASPAPAAILDGSVG